MKVVKALEIMHYQTEEEFRPYQAWLDAIEDVTTRARISARVNRAQMGNFGDSKSLGIISEMRLDFGPGYRVYYGMDGKTLVILLLGGDKSTQTADIAKAKKYWNDYLKRTHGK